MLRIAAAVMIAGLLAGCATTPVEQPAPLRYEVTAAALPDANGKMQSWIIRTDRVTGKTWRYETRKTKTGPHSSVVRTGWYPMDEGEP